MNKKSIPLFIGVIASFLVIWLVNNFLLVDPCLHNAGSFDYIKGHCLLENGDVKISELGKYLFAIYFLMGIFIAVSVSFFIRKIFNIEQ